MKIYGTYKMRYVEDGQFQPDRKLKGWYDLSYFLEYPEYQLPTLSIKDGSNLIPDSFLWTEYRLLEAEYDENIVLQEWVDSYIASVPPEFELHLFNDKSEALIWTRDNTTLPEIEPGLFLVRESIDMLGIQLPRLTLDLR